MIKNINNIIFIAVSSLITINYTFFSHRIIFRENPYITADWLINYQGGFVRRGFIGEILFQLNNFLKIDILHLVFFLNLITILIFFFLIYKIIKSSLSNQLFLLYCLIPSTLMFTFFDPLAAARKDYFIVLPYLFYAFFLDRLNLNLKIFIILFLIISILTHELTFFFIPFLFAVKSLNYPDMKLNLKNYKFEIYCLIAACSTILSLMIFKNPHSALLCESLTNLKLSANICNGVIRDFSNPIFFTKDSFIRVLNIVNDKNYFTNHSIYLFLNFLPIIINLLNKKLAQKIRIKFLLLSIISTLFLLPLILITTDWGRYLNVLFIIHIVYLHFLIKNLRLVNFELSTIKKIIIIPILFLYLTSWHMPHCCQVKVGNGFYYVGERILFRINDESNETHKFGKDTAREIVKYIFGFF